MANSLTTNQHWFCRIAMCFAAIFFFYNANAQAPTLGTYTNTSVVAGRNTTITPSVAPTNVVKAIAYTGTSFEGILTVNPATGVVSVTDALHAGSYNVTVKGFNASSASTTSTFTLTVNNPTCSNGTFTSLPSVAVGNGGQMVVVGDFNRDGFQDLANASASTNSISVRNGNGAGAFTGTTELAVGTTPRYLAVGDFNRDGFQDIVNTNVASANFSISLNNGAGGFFASTAFVTTAFPTGVSVGDFNNDTYEDLVIGTSGGNVTVHLGDGAGSFTALPTFATGGGPAWTIAVGDFNEDGNQDLAITASNGIPSYVYIRLGNGTGTFSGTTNIAVSPMCETLLLGDFNNDNHQDFAVTSVAGFSVSVRYGDGAGNFTGTTEVSMPGGNIGLAIGDFNGDGNEDVAATTSAQVHIRFGNGAGNFPGSGTVNLVSNNARRIAVGDFNQDNIQDFAVPVGGNQISMHMGVAADINVTGNSVNITDGDATPSTTDHTNFGVPCSGSVVRTFTVQNTGTTSLTLSSMTITGTNSTEFVITVPPSGSINAAASSTFQVTFTPGGTGVRTAILNIYNDDCNESVYDFAMQGTGITPVSGTTVVTNVACFGNNNGAINLTPSGGTPGYTYNWGSSITTQDRTNLVAGTYSVIITDANGCTGTLTSTITEPQPISLTAAAQTNVSCFGGSNGAFAVNNANGGTGSFTYDWAPGNPTGDGTTSVTGLTAGTWSVTATDVNGCTAFVNFTITEPPQISFTAAAQTNVSCFGGSNGAFEVNPANGGAGSFTYDWAPGNPTGDGTTSVTGLTAGTWSVTATDANGCSQMISFTITQPPSIIVTATSQTDVLCNGGNNGTATVAASGGTGSLSYLWNNSGTTNTATGLSAGNYSVTITDANSCSATASFTITAPAAITTTGTQTNVSCANGSNGVATVTASGGTGSFTYSWTPSGATTASATGIYAGLHTVTITDANGCTATHTFNIQEPNPVYTLPAQTNVSCFGGNDGTATVTAGGGSGGYTYSWAPSGGNAATATGLIAGTYTATTTDVNGCTASEIITVAEPTAITFTSTQTDILCNGGNNGSAMVVATGGTGSFSYLWNFGGTGDLETGLTAGNYSVIITDANSCTATVTFIITEPSAITFTSTQTDVLCNAGNNGSATVVATGGTGALTYAWSSGGTTDSETGLISGNYSVVITDANSCSTTATFTISEPTAITFTSTQTDMLCHGGNNGSARVVATGGTGSFTYAWTSGGTSDMETGLIAGSYSVVITDANSCSTTATFIITEPTAITFTSTQTDVLCNGGNDGSATVVATGGTGSYAYAWPSGGNNATETGLPAGNYSVIITDFNSCSTTATFTITEPTVLAASVINTSNPTTCGGTDGAIAIDVTGGTASYTFLWSNGDTNEDLVAVAAGAYNATITDANGCTTTIAATINDPNPPVVTVSLPIDTVCGSSPGTISLSGEFPAGGNWSGNTVSGNSFDPFNAGAGTHYITYTYTDTNGCTGIATDNLYVDLCLGAEEIVSATWSLYPNPTSGTITITTNATLNSDVIVEVYSTEGKLLFIENKQQPPAITLDLASEPVGTYFIRLTVNGETTMHRIVKM
jgi:hypothetical protein